MSQHNYADKNVFNNRRAAQDGIVITKEYRRALRMQVIIPIFIGCLASIVCIGLCFCLWFNPMYTDNGFIFAEPGTIEINDKVLIAPSEANYITRLTKLLDKQEHEVGTVVAGPFGVIRALGGTSYSVENLDGTIIPVVLTTAPPDLYLDEEYIVSTPSGQKLFSATEIRGKIKK